MNMTEPELIARLSAIPGYVDAFARAFGDGAITRPRIEASLATFERSILAGEAPFDRWIKGDDTAISASAQHGFRIFNGKARCSSCHSGPSFSDGSFPGHRYREGQGHRAGQFLSDLRQAAIRVQDADIARRCASRALHARRIGRDPGRRHRAVQQGRNRSAEPVSGRQAAVPDSQREEGPHRLSSDADRIRASVHGAKAAAMTAD